MQKWTGWEQARFRFTSKPAVSILSKKKKERFAQPGCFFVRIDQDGNAQAIDKENKEKIQKPIK